MTGLGEHRLKDIAEAVPIFQLGDGSFPPLKTISNTNLPRPASSFVGRDDELLEVLSRFEEGARLVTLTGPGGTGKTRLAIEAASDARSRPTRRASSGSGSPLCETLRSSRRRSADAGRQERTRRAHRRPGDAAASRQPRAGDRGSARALRAPHGLSQPDTSRHEPRAASHPGRGRVRRASSRRTRGRVALLRALAARAER